MNKSNLTSKIPNSLLFIVFLLVLVNLTACKSCNDKEQPIANVDNYQEIDISSVNNGIIDFYLNVYKDTIDQPTVPNTIVDLQEIDKNKIGGFLLRNNSLILLLNENQDADNFGFYFGMSVDSVIQIYIIPQTIINLKIVSSYCPPLCIGVNSLPPDDYESIDLTRVNEGIRNFHSIMYNTNLSIPDDANSLINLIQSANSAGFIIHRQSLENLSETVGSEIIRFYLGMNPDQKIVTYFGGFNDLQPINLFSISTYCPPLCIQ